MSGSKKSRRRPSRGAAAAALSLSLGVMISGCGSESEASDASSDGVRIAFANISNKGAVFKPLSEQLSSYAESIGWSVENYDNDTNAEATLSNAKLMAASDADVLVNWVTVAGMDKAVGKIFADSGKPCISVQVAIEGCPLMAISDVEYGRGIGAVFAEEAAGRGWTSRDTTFIGVSAGTGGKPPQDLIANSFSTFSEQFEGLEQVDADEVTLGTTSIGDNYVQVDGDGRLETTAQVVRDVLQSLPPGRHVVISTTNDDSALGAVSAIKASGRDVDDFMLGGAGSSPNGLDELRSNPMWVAEGGVFFKYWAAYILAMADSLLRDADLPELTPAPQNVLTKATVDEFYDGGEPVRAPDMADDARYLLDSSDVLGELKIADPS